MCGCHDSLTCAGCAGAISRRELLRGCGAAAAAGALAPTALLAEAPKAGKTRVGLVFLSNSRGREMWPYPNYDCAARHKQILELLGKGCPQVEFVPVVVKHPADIVRIVRTGDQYQADPHIEHAIHLVGGDAAKSLEPAKNRWHFPGRQIDVDLNLAPQHAFDILAESTARNMADTVYDILHFVVVENSADGAGVDSRRCHQRLPDGLTEVFDMIIDA